MAAVPPAAISSSSSRGLSPIACATNRFAPAADVPATVSGTEITLFPCGSAPCAAGARKIFVRRKTR